MTAFDPLARITDVLREELGERRETRSMPPARDEAIANLAAALRARRARVRRRRFFGGLAVAASIGVAIGATFALRHHAPAPVAQGASELGRLVDPSGAATTLRDGHAERVGAGERVPAGTELRTTNAEASLDFESGTHVLLGKASRVHLVEQTSHKRFSLDAGELTAHVAKLKADERFVVSTSDAEIEVRGTAFRVAVVPSTPDCGDGTTTRLDVTEGVVVVRHAGSETRVAAGQHWPACTTPETVAAASALPDAPSAKPLAKGAPAHATPASSSHLAEQNDLFDEGMRLKRSGNFAAASAKLEKLTTDYPGGPLGESAWAERMRIAAASDKARAATLAREYLRRYPKGFARSEAEALLP